MTLKQFIEWASSLPPDMQDAEMCSVVGSAPLLAKRVVAYRKDDFTGIVLNSMGTHLATTWWEEAHMVSVLLGDGTVHIPGAGATNSDIRASAEAIIVSWAVQGFNYIFKDRETNEPWRAIRLTGDKLKEVEYIHITDIRAVTVVMESLQSGHTY